MESTYYDGIETSDIDLITSLIAYEDMLGSENLDVIWNGIRDPSWQGEELLHRKKQWLESRLSFYNDKRWRQYSWKKSLRREKNGAIDDFLYFIDTNSANSCHIKKDFRHWYWYIPSRVNFFKFWERVRKDNESFLSNSIIPHAGELTMDGITKIWCSWAERALPLKININPDAPYGLTFREKVSLTDKDSLDCYGSRKIIMRINRENKMHNSALREFSVFVEWVLSGSEEAISSLVSGEPCCIRPFYRWKSSISKELYFSANAFWNCNMPKMDKEKRDTRPYLEWKEKNPEEARIWMNETDKALCRALWNLEHPDDQITVLYEPNYCNIENLTVF